jgi:uncharacterized protein
VLKSIDEQGKLTAQLGQSLGAADTKQRLQDLYLPFKPKRRTKAQIAREAGLDVLRRGLLADPALDPQTEAARYLKAPFTTDQGENPGVPDAKAAFEGARQALLEQFAEDAALAGELREHLLTSARVVSKVAEGREETGAKFRDYFDRCRVGIRPL